MRAKQTERGEAERRRERLAEKTNVITLQPRLGEAVAARLKSLGEALKNPAPTEQDKADVRAFFAKVEIIEADPREPFEIKPFCHEAALGGLDLGDARKPTR